jgi:CRISPR/Cas system-associated exonuclease Cas4 (RecB family)
MTDLSDTSFKTSHYVVAFELSDVVPRRCPSLPNVYLGVSKQPLGVRFETLIRMTSGNWFINHLVSPRSDLCSEYEYPTREVARAAASHLTKRLSAEGYTVNRNTRTWSVYVIELDSAAIADPGLGYMYVGETSKSHEQRLSEHLTRARNSKTRLFSPVVASHGVRLRPELAPGHTLFSKETSKEAESIWARHLRNLGYVVAGGY